jgi:hypothetical protein
MTTVATGQVLLAGSSPAGLAASFAAPSGLAVTRPERMFFLETERLRDVIEKLPDIVVAVLQAIGCKQHRAVLVGISCAAD